MFHIKYSLRAGKIFRPKRALPAPAGVIQAPAPLFVRGGWRSGAGCGMLEKTEKADKKEEYFMNEFAFGVVEKRIQRTIEALKKNAMDAFYVKTAAEVAPLAASLMPEGSTVACGGSATLAQTGVMELLASGRYHF